jgi:hypothetical protein
MELTVCPDALNYAASAGNTETADAFARRLLRIIFPRQYGLPNAFEPAGPLHRTIKKTPYALKSVSALVGQLRTRHAKYDCRKALNRFCPTTVRFLSSLKISEEMHPRSSRSGL